MGHIEFFFSTVHVAACGREKGNAFVNNLSRGATVLVEVLLILQSVCKMTPTLFFSVSYIICYRNLFIALRVTDAHQARHYTYRLLPSQNKLNSHESSTFYAPRSPLLYIKVAISVPWPFRGLQVGGSCSRKTTAPAHLMYWCGLIIFVALHSLVSSAQLGSCLVLTFARKHTPNAYQLNEIMLEWEALSRLIYVEGENDAQGDAEKTRILPGA